MALFGFVLVGCSVFQTVAFATTYTVTIQNQSDSIMACQIYPKNGDWFNQETQSACSYQEDQSKRLCVRTFPKEALTQYVGAGLPLNYSMDSDQKAPSNLVSQAMNSMYISCVKSSGSVYGHLLNVPSGSKLVWQNDALDYDKRQ